MQPECIEILHKPIRADNVVAQPRLFQVHLGLAHRAASVCICTHRCHQHHFAQPLLTRLVDQRNQQLILIDVTRRGKQKSLVHASKCRRNGSGIAQIQMNLPCRRGCLAGRTPYAVSLLRERLRQCAANSTAGGNNEGGSRCVDHHELLCW